MATKQRCPICGQEYTGAPALSRTDNQTLICPDCGTRQALAAPVKSQNLLVMGEGV